MRSLLGLASVLAITLVACGPDPLSDVCSADALCNGGGTYKLCTANAGTSAFYLASDGTKFACVTASDCQDARRDADAWCLAH